MIQMVTSQNIYCQLFVHFLILHWLVWQTGDNSNTKCFFNFEWGFLFLFSNYSSVEPDQEKASHFFERTVPDPTQPGSQLKHPGAAHPTAGLKGEERLSSPDPPIHNLTWSIRQEVERLMQDQNKYSSDSSSQANKAKKQPVRLTSNLCPFQHCLDL